MEIEREREGDRERDREEKLRQCLEEKDMERMSKTWKKWSNIGAILYKLEQVIIFLISSYPNFKINLHFNLEN